MNSFKNKKNDYIKNVKTTEQLLKFIQNLEKKPKLIFFFQVQLFMEIVVINIKKKLILFLHTEKIKLYAKKLLNFFEKNFKLQFNILRFYSIYGDGLKKQLIWDACKKMKFNKNIFFGTGEEIKLDTY